MTLLFRKLGLKKFIKSMNKEHYNLVFIVGYNFCVFCTCFCCWLLFAEPPQILPIPFPTPPPDGVTVSSGQPTNTTITPGTDVTIYCPSSGIDTPSIEWFRDGVIVVSGGRFTISTTTLPGAVITSVLSIDDFRSADAGTYTCTATNIVGSDDGNTTLIAIES